MTRPTLLDVANRRTPMAGKRWTPKKADKEPAEDKGMKKMSADERRKKLYDRKKD